MHLQNLFIMCDTCGCSQPGESFSLHKPGNTHDHKHEHKDHEHKHGHAHDHHHPHPAHEHDHSHTISIQTDILGQNNLMAERNRGFFEARNITAYNLVSSPGSGKTSLLVRTLTDLGKLKKFCVIEGDQQTTHDADRISATGVPVIQVNTGNGCHLDAAMVRSAVKEISPADGSILFIENVGNLVCPAMFDLGEDKRVVIISTTEGEDKPLKYPNMFHTSHLCIINKTDLLPYVDFSIEKLKENALRVNHHLEFIELSVKSGNGMQDWYNWLEKN